MPEMAVYEEPSKIFLGVNFLLLGFDSVSQQKVRSKIVNGGGVDVGQYGEDCTHVIVDKVVYDDPVCVAARRERKTLVTGLWVDHSFDVGMPVDPTSIIYRPLRDLNGISGAKSLVICLTGYLRQDRDDIMTMVGLMGANFSKPLVANKVTHLICYKFEGEKYELAKKIQKIKLVNHQWLEDCLKYWKIFPEANYAKSGYELEMMEAEAKDSEDEAPNAAMKQQLQKESASASESPSTKEKVVNPKEAPFQKETPSRVEVPPSVLESLSTKEKEVKLKEVPFQKGTPSRSGEPTSESGNSGNIPMDKTPIPAHIGNDMGSVSTSNKKSPRFSASNHIELHYSRTTSRKATLPLEPVGSAGTSPVAEKLRKVLVSDCFSPSSSRMEKEGILSTGLKSLLEENLSHPEDEQLGILPEKRKVAISGSGYKIQRTDHNMGVISKGVLEVHTTKQSASEPLTNELHGMIGNSPINIAHGLDGNAANAHLNPLLGSPIKCLNSVTPEIMPNCSGKTLQMSSEKRERTNLDDKKEVAGFFSDRPESVVNESALPHNGEFPPSGTNISGTAKSHSTVGLDFSEGKGSSRSKSLKRKPLAKRTLGKPLPKRTLGKPLAKKTLGSTPSVGRGKAGYQKDSVNVNEKVSLSNSPTGSVEGIKTEDTERVISSGKIRVISPTSDAEMDKNIKMASIFALSSREMNKTGIVDDVTDAPENQEDTELDAVIEKVKSGDVDEQHSVDTRTESNVASENRQLDDQILGTEDELLISGEKKSLTEADNAHSGKKLERSEPTFMRNTEEDKIISGRKRTLTETKKSSPPIGAKLESSSTGDRRKGVKNGLSKAKAKAKKVKGSLPVVDGNTITAPLDMPKNTVEMDKENIPVHVVNLNVNHKKRRTGKLTRSSNRKSKEKDVANPGAESVPVIPKVRLDPVWFILSGHKLQRKEFKQVIMRLRGKVCRDSHQWTYQATHFIVPDPLRRTEKFFAAAAAGRWILKTDYLTASNEAGRFLAEEPYEWHQKGLNEDGAINLEAPRKWRLLRERTGHGAFYGMRIIIYGECIAPPLDTLKRAVKAGDGTILATSPPYTRILESGGVDFAIVSPGMPRVDVWVQEFLRHEIPCVLADYLVEYVCKPGYSLDRHVQYNTLAWAEKSFRNLVNRAEEVLELEVSTPQGDDEADIRCHLCGSGDNGEELLICGDESGSSGCGIGAHMGCCDPPVEEIPEGDWFCGKCKSKSTGNKSRKRISKSKPQVIAS